MLEYAAALENRQITDAYWLWRLGDALAKLANKMEPQAAAAEIARRGAQRLEMALENPQEWKDPLSYRILSLTWGNTLAALANKAEPQAAAEIARRGAQRLAAALKNPQKTDSDWVLCLGYALAEFCRLLPSARHTHLLALSNMLLLPYDWKLLNEVCAQLRTEDLAEVLKYPFCTGEAEHVVLEQLKAKTQRDFGGDAWKFVEQANSLGIKNVDNPAKRPSVQDTLKELDAL